MKIPKLLPLLLCCSVPAFAETTNPPPSQTVPAPIPTTVSPAPVKPVQGPALAEDKSTSSENAIVIDAAHATFEISLYSNPTTGFSWFIKDYDARFIQLIGKHFVAPNSKLIGQGGLEKWTFKATPQALQFPTMTTITLIYARPWELVTSTEREFVIMTSQSDASHGKKTK